MGVHVLAQVVQAPVEVLDPAVDVLGRLMSSGGRPRAVHVVEAAVVVSITSKDRLVRSQTIVAHDYGRRWPRGPVAASGTWSR